MLNSDDFNYCASSFLMYRTIIDKNRKFDENLDLFYVEANKEKKDLIHNSDELYDSLKKQIDGIPKNKKIGLCLSGGIDSAIMAKFVPKNTIAYTFKCVVPGVEVTDESIQAKRYADECGIKHKIIEIYWEDFDKYAPILMKHKGQPIHSIEVQIYKAALEAKKDGIDILIFGESSDVQYGGMSQLLSKDWTFGEFIDRYSYVLPYKVLKNYNMDLSVYEKYTDKNGYVDVHEFNRNIFYEEGLNSYINACETAGIELLCPFSNTKMAIPLDYNLVRSGKNKYMVREVFEKLYKDFAVPLKTPMPRAVNEWLKDYTGPTNYEIFWPNCATNMTGDQKWYIYSLDLFINKVLRQGK